MVLEHLVLDVNGTLSWRGELIDGVAERVEAISASLTVHLLTADTYGTASELGERLGAGVTRIESGDDKAAFIVLTGPGSTVAIGNGRNDVAMFGVARLSIAVVGPEGASAAALAAADVVASSILDALDLLIDDRALRATLRA
jgi:soluble P-type ATPase